MDDVTVRQYWEKNAHAWTLLTRAGYDVCRDLQTSPAFFAMLPDVRGLTGLDIGCGEGHNTRKLAERGARVFALDLATDLACAAVAYQSAVSSSIRYLSASALHLPFPAQSFDFVTGFMSLMDVAGGPEQVLPEIARVLKQGGFLQFSILHPCFTPLHRRVIRDSVGVPVAIELARYFDRTDDYVERWTFSAAPAEVIADLDLFAVPRFHRTLGDWLNAIAAARLRVEACVEPTVDDETFAHSPILADTRIAPYFLLLRCRR
jgi:SAM-dependent methyltransferase